ncbi:UrcA family protein [Phenylobacterium sp. LH3H17]|uniref:UrcA family protein n=1 Tax=Phenylobacterium sp. LH3H17 TaxID=2903901 RepID=UPI0020C98C62|nr:UrcA family protein [Phenylobacterium sp. LH3H17]UTP38553.1 UrcA family protein [Phenylobacterium sp. LH3H17]
MKHLAYLVLMSLLMTGAAHAESAMVVKVRDLNLHTKAGAYLAVQRMNDAASLFCETRARDGAREWDVTTLKCRRDMAQRAASKLRAPNVVRLQTELPSTSMLASR